LFLGENIRKKEGMMENLVADLSHVTNPAIQKRAVENLAKADEVLGRSVAVGLKLEK
jgi:catalase